MEGRTGVRACFQTTALSCGLGPSTKSVDDTFPSPETGEQIVPKPSGLEPSVESVSLTAVCSRQVLTAQLKNATSSLTPGGGRGAREPRGGLTRAPPDSQPGGGCAGEGAGGIFGQRPGRS